MAYNFNNNQPKNKVAKSYIKWLKKAKSTRLYTDIINF